MSYYDYETSRLIAAKDFSFYSLIMAAIRRADGINLQKLQQAFPETFAELQTRYNSPGGKLPDEDMISFEE